MLRPLLVVIALAAAGCASMEDASLSPLAAPPAPLQAEGETTFEVVGACAGTGCAPLTIWDHGTFDVVDATRATLSATWEHPRTIVGGLRVQVAGKELLAEGYGRGSLELDLGGLAPGTYRVAASPETASGPARVVVSWSVSST